jgi:rhodanese-related sulfurtransferase
VAKKLGYEQAQSLAGGLAGWRSANLPLEKA